jgi:hypothetical protein
MSTETILIMMFIVLVVFAIELAFRKNRKEYAKAEVAREEMQARQKESLDVLKEMNMSLKEIAQKLEKNA